MKIIKKERMNLLNQKLALIVTKNLKTIEENFVQKNVQIYTG